MKLKHLAIALSLSFFSVLIFAQNPEKINKNKFRQLYYELPTPNNFRTATGEPGHEYWQQKVDYNIELTLDDENQKITGKETITYKNNSPNTLKYVWLQLDQNIRQKNSDKYLTEDVGTGSTFNMNKLPELHYNFDGGFYITKLHTSQGENLQYTIVKTMMRIDLPQELKTGESFSFNVEWWYNINNRLKDDGRSGYEYFEEDDNYLYAIAQFYPRLCVYNDHEGWQHRQFLGRGEFSLEFGDFDVKITVPSDHIVSATGELQNPKDVLTPQQIERLEKSKNAKTPVFIVTKDEAIENEKTKVKKTKTWHFKAEMVRDFAFASSRKFMWDAIGVPQNNRTVMAMSFYPKEGTPLWEKKSTELIAHTIKVYSKYTFDFPYPVAQSIHTDDIGMEYPMICFNGGRPNKDGSYSSYQENYMISVIIHEIGHNYFPMIVNSDERQWSWMDEGLNTFLQYLAEQELQPGYPSWAGEPRKIVNYMKSSNVMPIMTNSEAIPQFGYNAYFKPTTALNILRETILGPELFDYAFKEYANRWMFKHPTPADFFRTMEDASGVDLDWFWRGWFYTTNNVDIGISDLTIFQITNDKTEQPDNKDYQTTPLSKKRFNKYYSTYFEDRTDFDISNFYYLKVDFKNEGGLIMPLILKVEYTDDTYEIFRVPAEIWRKNDYQVSKIFVTEKPIKNVILDPNQETADVNQGNNYWPNREDTNMIDWR